MDSGNTNCGRSNEERGIEPSVKSLPSFMTRYSTFMLYFSLLRPRIINHFSKDPWFLSARNGLQRPQSGCQECCASYERAPEIQTHPFRLLCENEPGPFNFFSFCQLAQNLCHCRRKRLLPGSGVLSQQAPAAWVALSLALSSTRPLQHGPFSSAQLLHCAVVSGTQ